ADGGSPYEGQEDASRSSFSRSGKIGPTSPEAGAMKKLLNDPAAVVEEMIEGLVAVFPGLRRLEGQTVLVRDEISDRTIRQVAVISGGGSGHEPAHAGYVGRGMLSAAVAGEVFTSPSPDAVLAALRATSGPRGALL